MVQQKRRSLSAHFERFSRWATEWTGSTSAFLLALLSILLWGVTGPLFGFSDTWQLVINTATTIVTFLMVFLIQRAQNKDAMAIQLKLNELVAAIEGASNRLINVEDLSEEEVRILHNHYCELVKLSKQDEQICESHSIEDARKDHARKRARRRLGLPAEAKPAESSDEPGREKEAAHPAG